MNAITMSESKPAPAAASADKPDDKAATSGAVARAIAAAGQTLSRVGGALFRVPIKAFRQNKFAVTTGLDAQGKAKSKGAASPLRVLLEQQGRSSVFFKQVLPSLAANVAVGAVTFSVFDHSIAAMARARARGTLPAWACSSGLSTGYVAPSAECDVHAPHLHMLSPRIGPDVFVAGALAGACQAPLVTMMESSSSWMRIKYRLFEQHLHAQAAMAANATPSTVAAATAAAESARAGVSVAAVEGTATTLAPPMPPRHIANFNIASTVREMLFRSGPATPQTTPNSLDSIRPTHGLLSHLSFRVARDTVSLGLFFFAFESVHARLKVVPYRWMEMEEDKAWRERHAPGLPVAASIVSMPLPTHPPPPELLASVLAWECVSVLSAGVLAGSACHVASFPFFNVLQHVENEQLRRSMAAMTSGQVASSSPLPSAWAQLSELYRAHGVTGLFRGAWGGPTATALASFPGGEAAAAAARTARRPALFSPLTIGLIVFTLSKTEHHSHQLQQWRMQRRERRQKLVRHEPVEFSVVSCMSAQPLLRPSLSMSSSACVFCTLSDAAASKALSDQCSSSSSSSSADGAHERILYADERVYVVADHRPAARLHLLVVTREHVRDCNTLDDEQLLSHMEKVGNDMLLKYGLPGEESQQRLGFHVPPFISVPHLHLHVQSGPYRGLCSRQCECCTPTGACAPCGCLRCKYTALCCWYRSVADVHERMQQRKIDAPKQHVMTDV